MTDTGRSAGIGCHARDVWGLIGSFDGLTRWHPAVLDCTMETRDGRALRHVLFVGGIRVTEGLLAHDDDAMVQRYGLVEGGRLPVADYTAILHVIAGQGQACTVDWSWNFQPAGAPESIVREAIEGILDAGMNCLVDRFGSTGPALVGQSRT